MVVADFREAIATDGKQCTVPFLATYIELWVPPPVLSTSRQRSRRDHHGGDRSPTPPRSGLGSQRSRSRRLLTFPYRRTSPTTPLPSGWTRPPTALPAGRARPTLITARLVPSAMREEVNRLSREDRELRRQKDFVRLAVSALATANRASALKYGSCLRKGSPDPCARR